MSPPCLFRSHFLPGVYGMNFDFMPELKWRWGYTRPAVLHGGRGRWDAVLLLQEEVVLKPPFVNSNASQAPDRNASGHDLHSAYRSNMSPEDFERFSRFIYDQVGIKLPPIKKTNGGGPASETVAPLLHAQSQPSISVFSSVQRAWTRSSCTLSTWSPPTPRIFFREPQHFEILKSRVLPQWVEEHGTGKPLKIWSAGCSTGMEPYTLAMVLSEFSESQHGFRFQILASDISTQALQAAMSATLRRGSGVAGPSADETQVSAPEQGQGPSGWCG